MTVIGDRTQARREELGLSQEQLGKLVRVSQQAIDQLEKGVTQRPRYILELAHALNVPAAWLLGTIDEVPSLREVPVKGLLVRGAVQAGYWQDSIEWEEDDWRLVAMPAEDSRYPGVPLFGLEVRGTSMNMEFPEGTILGCIHLIQNKNAIEVRAGHFVIVERKDASGRTEATVKQVQRDADGQFWLWPRSTDPRYQAPIKVDEGDEVRITALVVQASRQY